MAQCSVLPSLPDREIWNATASLVEIIEAQGHPCPPWQRNMLSTQGIPKLSSMAGNSTAHPIKVLSTNPSLRENNATLIAPHQRGKRGTIPKSKQRSPELEIQAKQPKKSSRGLQRFEARENPRWRGQEVVSRGGGEMAAVSGKKRRWPWMASLGSDDGE
ncbi:hypothetical protein OsJ_23353 [Oryza sativa Japonica Group]|uniref:Uncharacterized protein n=1 Tax=Oryza sativa subsp. japonica TaxID=39947 RepID=Q8H4Z4_ORYSJ|nr:hypothetical protein OsJ_23353 [Oryza sativa Japonica Group]BAC24883.1 hypothetical protein [Oryza sativa Japonica Group]